MLKTRREAFYGDRGEYDHELSSHGLGSAGIRAGAFLASHLDGASFELPIGEKIVSCRLLPGFSAFVGSDLYAGALACGMATSKELTLLVDLGTNGEILLGNHDGILATATAAGPAFEGGANRGVFGADLVKYLATLRREGLLDDTGLLSEPYFTRGVRIGNLVLTQETVRNLQVAKAAIMSGIQVLLRRAGKGMEEVDRVILAGGFGYSVRPRRKCLRRERCSERSPYRL